MALMDESDVLIEEQKELRAAFVKEMFHEVGCGGGGCEEFAALAGRQ